MQDSRVLHARVTCDRCGQNGILGTRYKCHDCPNYDLCSTCLPGYMSFHNPTHSFVVFEEEGQQFEHRVGTTGTVVHEGFKCDVCDGVFPIVGIRYSCSMCRGEFNLCYRHHSRLSSHLDPLHEFEPIFEVRSKPDSIVPEVPSLRIAPETTEDVGPDDPDDFFRFFQDYAPPHPQDDASPIDSVDPVDPFDVLIPSASYADASGTLVPPSDVSDPIGDFMFATESEVDPLSVVAAQESFFRHLLPLFDLESAKPNCVFSSFSVFRVLVLTMAGATGTTLSEMAGALCVSRLRDLHIDLRDQLASLKGSASLCIAEGIWVDQKFTLRPAFEELARSTYGARVEAVGFPQPGERKINDFAYHQTRGLIPKIVQGLTSRTTCVLVNCVYFKARWDEQFKKSDTDPNYPFRSGETRTYCNMMRRWNADALLGSHSIGGCRFESCQLDYQDNRYAMLFLKPQGGQIEANFNQFLSVLGRKQGLLKSVQSEMRKRELSRLFIPKFTIESQGELSAMMKKLGMVQAFSAGSADFSRIVSPTQENLYISRIVHKAKLIVDEEGTEAAAATAVFMDLLCARPRPEEVFEFVLDSPFACFIVEKLSKTILFTGIVRRL